MEAYMCRYGEIALKGKNRVNFEKKLISNIQRMLFIEGIEADVKKIMGRVLVKSKEDCSCLKRVFGLVSYSPCCIVETEEELKEKLVELLSSKKFDSFRLSINRANKQYPKRRIQLQREIGQYLEEKWKVDLKNYDLEVFIEVSTKGFLIYFEKIECFGGLPVGIEGKLYALIEDASSIKAALLMMRRGCEVLPIGFKEQDISVLDKFGNKNKFRIVQELSSDLPLVVHDSLENYKEYEGVVFRPLVGYDKELFEGFL